MLCYLAPVIESGETGPKKSSIQISIGLLETKGCSGARIDCRAIFVQISQFLITSFTSSVTFGK